jgi:hypothetical protein
LIENNALLRTTLRENGPTFFENPFFVSEVSNQSRGGRKPRDEKERNSSSPLSWEYVVWYGRFELGIKPGERSAKDEVLRNDLG